MHNWNKWKPLAQKIKNRTVEVFEVKPFNETSAYSCYSEYSDKIALPIYKFITGIDPLETKQEIFAGKVEAGVSTQGKKIQSVSNIVLADQISDEELQKLADRPDAQKEALKLFDEQVKKNGWDKLLKKESQTIKVLLMTLPQFDGQIDPEYLVQHGLIK